jgi:PAS domain S-box-containing protein
VTPAPTIVLVDDAADVRTVVRAQFRLSAAFEVVGEGANGLEAVELAARHHPDVMLLDVSMPVLDGCAALPQIRAASPATRVVMYTGVGGPDLAAQAAELGAAAFVEKATPVEELETTLLEVANRGGGARPVDRAAVGHDSVLAEHRFKLLVEAVQDYAIFMLDPQGRVSSWNAGAQRSKGYAAEEIIGQHFRVFYPPEVQERGHPEWELEQALRDGAYEEEGWRLRKDGSRFWASVTITAVRDPQGELVGFAKVTRDTTERRAMLERLEEANRRLAEANEQLAELAEQQEQFFTVTAHELRSPVSVLSGAANTLAKHVDDLEAQDRTDLAAAVSHSSGQLRRLLDDLLTASRLHARRLQLAPVDVDLADHLDTVVGAMQQSTPTEQIRVVSDRPLHVVADPVRLTQMIDNLLVNAFRHGEPPVDVSARAVGDVVEIVVRDSGAGVSEEQQGRLFQRFETGSSRGTGLGLFLVRELARAHGGDATYRPSDGGFVVTLPRGVGA